MIPREQLERWKALADAATPGPWEYLDVAGYPEVCQAPATYDVDTVFSATSQGAENAKLTAAAREAVPILLAEFESLGKEIMRLRAALDQVLATLHAHRDDYPKDFGVFENHVNRAVIAALKEAK